jgi:hypothetical protein
MTKPRHVTVTAFERRQRMILRAWTKRLEPWFMTRHPDTYDDAVATVERLVEFVRPGWRLIAPVGRPGPKVAQDEDRRRSLLRMDYEDFLRALRDVNRHDLRQRPGESEPAYHSRLVLCVEQVWKASDCPEHWCFATDPKTGKRPLQVLRTPLSRTTINDWLRSRRFENAVTIRDYLAYRLAGHLYEQSGGKSLKVDQIRGIVQQQRRRSKRK